MLHGGEACAVLDGNNAPDNDEDDDSDGDDDPVVARPGNPFHPAQCLAGSPLTKPVHTVLS